MKPLPLSRNVALIVTTVAALFILLLGAAVYVGILEGGYGCGGGTVGAMIGLGGVVFGFMIGLAVKFADTFRDKADGGCDVPTGPMPPLRRRPRPGPRRAWPLGLRPVRARRRSEPHETILQIPRP